MDATKPTVADLQLGQPLKGVRFLTSQELQTQVLRLPLPERWQLVQKILASIQSETASSPELFPLQDSDFSHVHYRLGSSGEASPMVKGTRIRVQTIAISAQQWKWQPGQIAKEYGLPEAQVIETLGFYELHKDEIDSVIAAEVTLAAAYVKD